MDGDSYSDYDLYCGSCGALFTFGDVGDSDDVACPDCGSHDVQGTEDLGV